MADDCAELSAIICGREFPGPGICFAMEQITHHSDDQDKTLALFGVPEIQGGFEECHGY